MLKIITSPDNTEIKEAKKLHEAKNRKEKGLFFFEGIHLLEEYVKNGRSPHCVFITEEAYNNPELSDLFEKCDEKRIIPQRLYDKITAEKSPQGIFTVSESSSIDVIKTIPEKLIPLLDSPAVVLESMRDPGNAGTVIRTAVSLGVKVIFTEDCADIFSAKVIRASMGAVFADSIYIVPSASTLAQTATNDGFSVYGAILDDKAKPMDKIEFPQKSLFIIGNEGSGLKQETISRCNEHAYIPMTGKTESLNAAIAASIIIWEISKKIQG